MDITAETLELAKALQNNLSSFLQRSVEMRATSHDHYVQLEFTARFSNAPATAIMKVSVLTLEDMKADFQRVVRRHFNTLVHEFVEYWVHELERRSGDDQQIHKR